MIVRYKQYAVEKKSKTTVSNGIEITVAINL